MIGFNNNFQAADDSAVSRDHVSMEYLRSNDRVQPRVQHHLGKLQGRPRVVLLF